MDGLGTKVGGGFHGGDGEELHHVILDHVTHGADFVIKSAAGADPFLFGHGDLNIIDEVTVPNRFPDGIGEAKIEKVLHGFFPEVVVDPKEIGFIEAGLEIGDEVAGGSEIVSKGFFDDDAGGEVATD